MNPPKPAFTYSAKIVRVIDGDTVVADIDLGMKTWRHNESLRLLDVRAAELTGPDKVAGQMAKEYLQTLMEEGEKVLVVTTKDKSDKYGRYLADIYLPDGTHVNQLVREHSPPAGK
jgi:micrococcal nuclease